MDDLIERLSEGRPCLDRDGGRCRDRRPEAGCDCAEAAAELARLRAEVERLTATLHATHNLIENGYRAIAMDTIDSALAPDGKGGE